MPATPPLPPDRVETIGFLLVPGFALMSYAAALEPLRAANVLAGGTLYRWVNVTTARGGGRLFRRGRGRRHGEGRRGARLDMLIVCAAGNPAPFAIAPPSPGCASSRARASGSRECRAAPC